MCGVVEGFKSLDLTMLRPLRRTLVNQYAGVYLLVQPRNFTFLHKFSSSDPLSNLILVRKMRLARKRTMEPIPEVLITKGILAS